MGKLFGTDGVRGVANTELTGRLAYELGRAGAYVLTKETYHTPKMCIRDSIRVDTYRASGAGGQHVNKTSSAIRITHYPTGIVVQCQNERSQFSNKDMAMKMLKSKLLELKIEENMKKLAEIRGDIKENAWGSQIRSYVFMPYNLVKDVRTGEETANVSAVMDGEIDRFINAYLSWIH